MKVDINYLILKGLIMKKFFDYYGYPLLTLLISGFIYAFVTIAVPTEQEFVILTFFKACICFAFGLSIYQLKKSKEWVKKLIVSLVFVYLMLYDMGYNIIPQITYTLKSFYISGFILNLIYVFLGWTFFH